MMASRYHCVSLRSIMALLRGFAGRSERPLPASASSARRRRDETPDDDGTLGWVKGDSVGFAMQREAAAVQEVFGLQGRVVGQAERPEGHLVGAFLPMREIEIGEDEDRVGLLGRHPGIG